MHFYIFKRNETLDVLLLPHKGTNMYSFVNLSKGHICPCLFPSIDAAIADLDDRQKRGLILKYDILLKIKRFPLPILSRGFLLPQAALRLRIRFFISLSFFGTHIPLPIPFLWAKKKAPAMRKVITGTFNVSFIDFLSLRYHCLYLSP